VEAAHNDPSRLPMVLTGKAADAVQMITSGIAAWWLMGATTQLRFLAHLAEAYTELGQFEDAWRCISSFAGRSSGGSRSA
jgi:hypothetical protein